MFTGIIEALGKVERIERDQGNTHFTLSCPFAHELKTDQSLSHNGACLTVVKTDGNSYTVTAIAETLKRTNLGDLKVHDLVNLERCVRSDGRLDGHIVQGHVDAVGTCLSATDLGGSHEFVFTHDLSSPSHLTVEKGSISVNGVSLTVVRSEPGLFSVHIIPYTIAHTNFMSLVPGSRVNLEFDIIGKYVARLLGERAR